VRSNARAVTTQSRNIALLGAAPSTTDGVRGVAVGLVVAAPRVLPTAKSLHEATRLGF
jgi:hypothetical protein